MMKPDLSAAGNTSRPRAFILLYAVGTMVLVSAMATVSVSTAGAELRVAQNRLYQEMAYLAAESGIEYAMAVINRELARTSNWALPTPIIGGPWTEQTYVTPGDGNPPLTADADWDVAKILDDRWNWMRARILGIKGQDGEHCEYRSRRLYTLRTDGTGALPSEPANNVTILQFQLALNPEPYYVNVYQATTGANPVSGAWQDPMVFYLRSRGEVLYDTDNIDAISGEVLASAYCVQTFVVLGPTNCGPNAGARATRLLWEVNPAVDLVRAIAPINVH